MQSKDLIRPLIGVALLGILWLGVYMLVAWIGASMGNLTGIQQATLSGVLVAGVALFLVLWSLGRSNSRKRREQVRRQRAELYAVLLDVWGAAICSQDGRIAASPDPSGQSDAESARDLEALTMQLMLWGSANVIETFAAYSERATGRQPGAPDAATLAARVISAMRKDIGTAEYVPRELPPLSALLRHPGPMGSTDDPVPVADFKRKEGH